jgi:hypothetical protein
MRAKDVCEIGLAQVVLFHEEPKSCVWLRIRKVDMAFFVVVDEVGHDVEYPDHRMRSSIVELGLDRTELDGRTVLKGAPSRSEGFKVYITCHGVTVVNQSLVFECFAVISTDSSRWRQSVQFVIVWRGSTTDCTC